MSVWSEKREERNRESNHIHTHKHKHLVASACPGCGNSRIIKSGLRELSDGSKIQVFKCRICSHKFSENYIRCQGQGPNTIYAFLQEAKKMDSVTETKTVTGNVRGKVLEYCFKMKRDGYAESTIRLTNSALKVLMDRGATLTDPETVKEVMAKQNWSGNRKRNVINAYTKFLKFLGLTWQPPKYSITRKIPFIPTEQEIDDLIAGCPNTVATFLQLLKETAMRCGEALRLKWKDVDLERRIITLNEPEKGSNPRIFSNLSGKLLSMLSRLPKESEKLFGTRTRHSLKSSFTRARKRLAYKLGNQRLHEIHFHTLRHWKATMLYHHKPDMLVVAEFLGHKDLESTRLYIRLEENLFKNLPNDEFITRIAFDAERARKFIEVGFEYVTGEYGDGGKIFRKRK